MLQYCIVWICVSVDIYSGNSKKSSYIFWQYVKIFSRAILLKRFLTFFSITHKKARKVLIRLFLPSELVYFTHNQDNSFGTNFFVSTFGKSKNATLNQQILSLFLGLPIYKARFRECNEI